MEFLFVILVLVIFCGSIAGLILLSDVGRMKRRLIALERKVERLADGPAEVNTPVEQAASSVTSSPVGVVDSPPADDMAGPVPDALTAAVADTAPDPKASLLQIFLGHLKANWMVWLGGGFVAMAGVFLARYSIERGLLGPTARIALGAATGVALWAAAEWLRRRTGGTSPSFAALAGGGSITLFAIVLAGLQMYAMYSTATALALLSAIALVTMALAYLHGPVLAALGMLGAYIVPLLVSSGQGNVAFALLYSLVISASALLLLRYVYRGWLWWGFLAGALGWWMLSLADSDAAHLRGWYLAALAYLTLAVPTLDGLLTRRETLDSISWKNQLAYFSASSSAGPLGASLLCIVLAHTLSLAVAPDYAQATLLWSPLGLVLLWSARTREGLGLLAWVHLVLLIVAIVAPILLFKQNSVGVHSLAEGQVYWFLAATALMYAAVAWYNHSASRLSSLWLSLAVLTPLLMLGTAYFLGARFQVSMPWAMAAVVIGLGYLALASGTAIRKGVDSLGLWLFFGGHAGISLAAVMVTREASLTVVFALQVISVSWIIKKFQADDLQWLLKALVALVIGRLTLNPWLAGYPVDVHWSLWTYGGSTVCLVAAAAMLKSRPALRQWTEAAAMHCLVLTLWAETRYWMHGSDLFSSGWTLAELGVYMALSGALSLVYFRRSLHSDNLQRLYSIYSLVLLAVFLLCYGVIALATLSSERWVWEAIGNRPVFNLMLLIYAFPLVLGVLFHRWHRPQLRRLSSIFSGAAGFVLVSLEIRQLWTGSVKLSGGFAEGELYTYSAIWLLMAVVTVIAGLWRYGSGCYRAGMVLLGLVIAKLFLIDASDLEGLLRIASFMGLGLSLLGLAYLNQKFSGRMGLSTGQD